MPRTREHALRVPGLGCRAAVLVSCMAVLFCCGCTVVRPIRIMDTRVPVDGCLAGASGKTALVEPFEAPDNPSWGRRAAKVLIDELSVRGAFARVSLMDKTPSSADYVVRGTIEHLSYGGTEGPTVVSVRIRVMDTLGGGLCFERSVRASMEEAGFHMGLLRMVDCESPSVEEVLERALRDVAVDLAERTALPAK